jgi:iron(III) transport system substrate-binding protein
MTIRSPDLIASLVASFVLLAACEQTPKPDIAAPSKDPVVVYFAGEDEAPLRRVLDHYADVSGVPVSIRRGSPQGIVDDLIADDVIPPADVLVTTSAADIARAAEEGALRPLFLPAIKERTPPWLRDPDDLWYGLNYRPAVIVYGTNAADTAEIPTYADLAEAGLGGQLCLSSSKNAVNRSVIATLVDSMGVRPAEIVVRGWLANLALPVFEKEDQLVAALGSGECRYGIASNASVTKGNAIGPGATLRFSIPVPAAVDITGVGVARHARDPNGAAALVEWLFQTDVLSEFALTTWSYPAIGLAGDKQEISVRSVGLAAWHEKDAAKLAERARYP